MRFWMVEKVGQRAAQPALVYEERPGALGLVAHDVLRLLLGADEEHDVSLAGQLFDDFVGLAQLLHGEREVDDVNAVALLEDERLHLWIPPAGLMAEVDARFKQLAHGDDGHNERHPSGSRPRASLAVRSSCGAIASSLPAG